MKFMFYGNNIIMFKQKCPICDSKLEYDIDNLDFYLMEEHYNCPNKDYSYSYEYGMTNITIGNKEFNYTYLDSNVKKALILKEIKLETERLKSLTRLE